MMDIEAFSLRYREKLDEAEVAGSIPNNVSLEVRNPLLHCQFYVILCHLEGFVITKDQVSSSLILRL